MNYGNPKIGKRSARSAVVQVVVPALLTALLLATQAAASSLAIGANVNELRIQNSRPIHVHHRRRPKHHVRHIATPSRHRAPQDGDMHVLEVQTYAEDFGVSTGSAEHALSVQQLGTDLPGDLQEKQGDHYAGLWFDNQRGEFVVPVLNEASRQSAVSDVAGTGISPSDYRIERVNSSWQQLEDAQTELEHSQRELLKADVMTTAINSSTNAVVVNLAREATVAQREALEADADKAQAKVEITTAETPRFNFGNLTCLASKICGSPLRGGVAIGSKESAHFVRHKCTAGFKAIGNTYGNRFLLTAGHCNPENEQWWSEDADVSESLPEKIGTLEARDFPGGDWAAYNANGTIWDQPSWPNEIAVWGENTEYDITSESGSYYGELVCISGMTSGVHCAPVTTLNAEIPVSNFAGELAFERHLVECGPTVAKDGDSGGPIFANHTALGLVSASNLELPVTETYLFYPEIIEATQQMGVHVATKTGAPPVAETYGNVTADEGGQVTVSGELNPHGLASLFYFQYGTTAGYGSSTQTWNGASGWGYEPVSGVISGLHGNTTYHYRMVANNGAGTDFGVDNTFTTPDWRPAISFPPARFPAPHKGELVATVNPHGFDTQYQFEWGATASYGNSTPIPSADIGAGISPVEVSQAIAGLKGAETSYHYRVVATNSDGTTTTPDHIFTTPMWSPHVETRPAAGITEEEATLEGTVNPEESSTVYQFEYGTSPAYGTVVPISPVALGSGVSTIPVSQRVGELRPETTYYYRVKATNAEGTSYSDVHTLTTFSTLASPVSFDREFSWVGEGVNHLSRPTGVAVDPMGNVWVADTGNNRVVEFDSEGNFITQFGSEPFGEEWFSHFTRTLDEPTGVVVNSGDEIIVADHGNARLVKFNNSGKYNSQWGISAEWEHEGDHLLSDIFGVTIGSEGRYLITEPSNGLPKGLLYGFKPFANNQPEILSTLFGGPSTEFGEEGGIVAGPNGTAWVTDRVRDQVGEQHLVESSGPYTGVYQPADISKVIGSPGSGPGQFDEPTGVALRPSGNLLVADTGNDRVEQFSPKGELLAEFGSSGSGEGQFDHPEGIATAPGGVEYVADTGNNRIEKWLQPGGPEAVTEGLSGGSAHEVTLHGTAWANGRATTYYFEYGPTTSYGKSAPTPAAGIGFSFGAFPVSQTLTGLSAETTYHYRLVAVNKQGPAYGKDGQFTTGEVGKPTIVYGGSVGSYGTGNGQLSHPGSSVVDPKGNLWVLDTLNCRVEEFNEKGEYLSKFGSGCSAAPGHLYKPNAMMMDPSGNIWIAEYTRVQELTQTGTFIRSIGYGSTNGLVLNPYGITSDSNGHIWVADTYNSRIQEFNEKGEFMRAVGSHGSGPGQFMVPQSIAVGPNGNLWITDHGDYQVIEMTETGEFIRSFEPKGPGAEGVGELLGTVVDSGNRVWVLGAGGNRVLALTEKGEYLAQFGSKGNGIGQFELSTPPAGISVDAKGNLWVTDTRNGRVERWEPSP